MATRSLTTITPEQPADFPLGTLLTFFLDVEALEPGGHDVTVVFTTKPFGELRMSVSDPLNTGVIAPGTLPRDAENDYTPEIIAARQAFIDNAAGGDPVAYVMGQRDAPHPGTFVGTGKLDEIAAEVVRKMELTLLGQEKGHAFISRKTRDIKAYELFLQGRSLLDQRANIEAALSRFNQAIERDPGFAAAYTIKISLHMAPPPSFAMPPAI